MEKFIERINNVIDVFKVTMEVSSNLSIEYSEKNIGLVSRKWCVYVPKKEQISIFKNFTYDPIIVIYAYSLDESIEVVINEKQMKIIFDTNPDFDFCKKKVVEINAFGSNEKQVRFYPKNKKQLQRLLQKLATYIIRLEGK